MAISTNGTIIARLAGGLYNQTLSSASYNEMVGSVKSVADINALANSLVSTDFAGKTDAQIATVLLTNLNLSSVAGLNNWVAAQITAAGAAGKGAKIVSLLNDYSNLTADAVYGASASSFNGKVDSALVLSQTAGFKGGDINAAATIAAAEKAAADKAAAEKAAAEKAAAEKAAAEAAAKKALDDAAAKKALDDAAAKKALDDAAAKKILDDAAAKKILDDAAAKKILDDAAAKKALDDAAAKKILDDKAAAEKVLTDAADKAAADASAAIDAASVADAAVTAAQTALTAATSKAALTDAAALTTATTNANTAATTAATAKTAADTGLVAANTALSTLLASANPVAADVVTANANVIIAGAKVTSTTAAAATAATAAAAAKTASDAATADDAAVVTAQTALNTAVTAATKAAADAVAAVAASKTAAAATAASTDDTVATAAATVAAAKGAGAAKVISDAAAKKILDDAAAKKILDDAAAKKILDDAAAKKILDDAAAKKIVDDKIAAEKVLTDAADKAAADTTKAIDAATAADTAVTTAQTALTAATTKAALTDAAVLANTAKTLADAVTTATTAKTNADKAVVDATTAYTAALNAANPVAADVVSTNATLLINTNKAAVAAKALTDATTAAALAKTASDAATADDAAVVAAQTALNTAVTADAAAAAAAITAAAAAKTAAALTANTTDDTAANTAVATAATKGAPGAKITTDLANFVAEGLKTTAYTTAKTTYDAAVTTAATSLSAANTANAAYDTAAATANTVALATAAQALAATSTTAAAKADTDAKAQQTAAAALKAAATATAITTDDTIADGAVTASATAVTAGTTAVSGAATDATAAAKAVADTTKKASDDKIIADALAIENAPKTFVLTTSADTGADFTGKGGNDTFNAVIVGANAAGTTLQAGDNITGGAGTDSLKVTATSSAGTLSVVGIQAAVEKLEIVDYTDANVVTFDASLFTGLTDVSLFASNATGDVKVSALNNLVAAGMSNGSGDLELAYTAAVIAGKADSQTLSVSNVTAGAFAVNGAEKLTITSSLTDNTLTSVTSVASIAVEGTKGLTITNALAATTTSFDASKAAGAVVAGFTAGGDVNAKGGAGNDTFDFAGGLTKDDVIDGGAGTNTVKTAETANRTYTGVTLTNVQTLEVAVTTNTLTALDVKALADTVGVTVRAGTDDLDVTVTNVGVGQVVTVVNDFGATLELGDVAVNLESNVGTSDSVSVALVAATSANQTLDLLTIDAGAESASVANSGAATTTKLTLTSLLADGAKTISFTGSGNFATTLNESAGGANVTTTVDASAATGTFGFTEGVTNDLTIKGSAGANTIAMGTTLNNKDTIIGGASTKDAVSATIGTATTATTGKFNISAVENLALTTTDGQTAIVDLSVSTGVTAITLAASGAAGSGNVTVKGLAAGTTVSTTEQTTNLDFDGSVTVALTDATGTADAITIGLNNLTTTDNFTLVATGIETVTLSAAAAGIHASSSMDVSGVAATKLVVTGGVAASGLDLTLGTTVLNKTVTSVDTSGFSGAVKVIASSASDASGVAVNAGTIIVQNAGAVDTFVGTTATGKVDTFTGKIGATSSAANFVTQLSKFETYDITFADGVAVTANTSQGLGDGDNVVTGIKLSGGLASSTYTATAGYIDGTKLTSFDASGLGGAISIQVDAGATTGTLSDLGSKLTIKGSTNATTDKVEYLTNGLAVSSSSTTGKLLTSGVETVVLTTSTAASTVEATGLVGVTTIAIEDGQNVTLTKLATGTALQLGNVAGGTVDEYSGTLTFSLADATGTADSVSITLVNTSTDNETAATLVSTGVETVSIAAGTSATSAARLDVSGVAASKIVLTKGLAGELLDLTKNAAATLNATTTTLDGSAFDGDITAIANVNVGTTVSAKTAVLTFTGSDLNDTVTVGAVGSEIGAAITSLNLGSGTGDKLTAYVTGSASLANVTNTETINLIAGIGDISVVGTSGANGVNQASSVVLTGGESGKVVTLSGSITDHAVTLDASALAGSVAMTFGDSALVVAGAADPIVIKGGLGSKDQVTATFADDAVANTGAFTMTGVETLVVNTTHAGASAGADVINLAGTTGLSSLVLKTGATQANSVTVNGLVSGTTVSIGSLTAAGQGATDAFQGVTGTLNLASATGTSDALTVNLNDTNAGASTATIVTNGVESLTLALGNTVEDHKVVLTNTNTNAATVTVTGTNTSADLTISTLADAFTTIAAADLKGILTMADNSRTGTTAMTITGGSGADTLIQKHASDVVDAGTGTDTLKVVANFVLGGIQVDLSSTTDQITSYNSFANSAIQKGFENLDLSGITGTFGADITARAAGSTITGTANADLITGGAGVDTFIATAGNDAVTGAGGNDIFRFTATLLEANDATSATYDGGAGTGDAITLTVATTGLVDADFRGFTNIETLNLLSGATNTIVLGTIATDTAGIVNIVAAGTGNDTITTGVGSHTVTTAAGTDSIVVTSSVAAAITSSAAIKLTTITDWAAADALTFTIGGTNVFTTAASDVAAATTLLGALDIAVTAAGNVNNQITWFVYGGDTYIVNHTGATTNLAATDVVVKLVGVFDLSDETFAEGGAGASTLTFN